MASFDPELATAPLHRVIVAAEAIGTGRGLPEVIALYTSWIAFQPAGAAHLAAAWFNLGAELAIAGDAPAAAQAYQMALTSQPGFVPAAVNLGLYLERQRDPQAALQLWTDALQPDDARIALLNQRGRLLEHTGHLAQAAESLRASLLTRHDQPDVVQHWLHLRQKMCAWPVLAETIPGLTPHDLVAQCRAARGAGADRRRADPVRRRGRLARPQDRAEARLWRPPAATATTASASATCRRTSAVMP